MIVAPQVKPEPNATHATFMPRSSRPVSSASASEQRDGRRGGVAVALDVVDALFGRDAQLISRRTR